MRPDQIERLNDLTEKLAEVVLEEADPNEWPGSGVPLSEMSKQERGDRYWCKKNASATFALLLRTQSLLTDAQDPHRNRSAQEDDDLEKQIKAKEKEADRMLKRVMEGAKKAANGKA